MARCDGLQSSDGSSPAGGSQRALYAVMSKTGRFGFMNSQVVHLRIRTPTASQLGMKQKQNSPSVVLPASGGQLDISPLAVDAPMTVELMRQWKLSSEPPNTGSKRDLQRLPNASSVYGIASAGNGLAQP